MDQSLQTLDTSTATRKLPQNVRLEADGDGMLLLSMHARAAGRCAMNVCRVQKHIARFARADLRL